MYGEAEIDVTTYIMLEPADFNGYYRRGCIKDVMKDYNGAIEDYTMAVTLKPDNALAFLCRGKVYRIKGETDKAMADFKEVVRLESVPEKAECAQYAYYYLGEKEKAIEVMNAILKEGDKDDYYNAACLYSIMGEKEKALAYLRTALEKGERSFTHMERDRDLDNIRSTDEYKALIDEYKKKQREELPDEQDADLSEYVNKVEEIPFTKEGSVCKVKCAINNLPLHFIFDTGASDVSISSVEATFMVKNDYLSSKDIVGKQRYLNANGEVSEGTVINLREVRMGNLHLDNVKASVVKNQSAPLLLGQSVLGRLGKIEIDNDKKVLKVTYKEKIK